MKPKIAIICDRAINPDRFFCDYLSLQYDIVILECNFFKSSFRLLSESNCLHKTIPVSYLEAIKFIVSNRPEFIFDCVCDLEFYDFYLARVFMLCIMSLFGKRLVLNDRAYPVLYSHKVEKNSFNCKIKDSVKTLIRRTRSFPWLLFKPAIYFHASPQCRSVPAKEKIRIQCYEASRIRCRRLSGYQHSKYTSPNRDKYFVFIDTNTAFSADSGYRGKKPLVTPERYFPEINQALSAIAEITGLIPLIQLHPKADYALASQLYRHQISDIDTVSAISNSSFVVTHHSTAFMVALYLRVPILFMRSSEMAESQNNGTSNWAAQLCDTVDYISSCLGTSVVNSDSIKCSNFLEKIAFDYSLYELFEVNHTYFNCTYSPTEYILANSLSKLV